MVVVPMAVLRMRSQGGYAGAAEQFKGDGQASGREQPQAVAARKTLASLSMPAALPPDGRGLFFLVTKLIQGF